MTRNPPSSPLNYPANNGDPIRIFSFDRAPTLMDFQNFKIRDFWIDTSSDDLWFLIDKGSGSGTWVVLGGTSVSTETITGNTGGAVPSDASNNINLLGSAPLSVTGTPASNTLTIDTDGTVATSYITDSGTATPAADVLNVLGGTGISTSGSGNTLTINAQSSASSHNLGFTYASSTFTITAADGSALSSTNPAYIRIQRKGLPGQYQWIKITANQSFIDASGVSTIIGNLFGLTTGIAHAEEIPFYIYGVVNDDEDAISFMISRFPFTSISPVSGKIGQSGSAIADTQGSFFSLAAITATEWDSNPCTRLGSFRMTMNASDDWTVAALATGDGINHYQEGTRFNMSGGQFGAKASNVFIDNGGTAPTVTTTNAIAYEINNNFITIDFSIPILGNGVGAVILTCKVPYIADEGYGLLGNMGMVDSATFNTVIWIGSTSASGVNNDVTFSAISTAAARRLLNTDATAGNQIFGRISFVPLFS